MNKKRSVTNKKHSVAVSAAVAVNRTDLSRALGVNIGHVSRIFSGKSMPSLKLAYRIARHLGITLDELCQHLGVGDTPDSSS